jgi:hypothetical protein
MSELHDLLASEASRGPSIAPPSFETIVARSRRRRVAQVFSVVAVVVVVTVAVAVPSVIGRHRTTVVAVGPFGATTEAAREAVTRQEAEELVAGVQLPAGAVASSTAPTQALAQPQNSPGSKNLIDVVRFYTVPGTIEDVLAYVKAHPATGTYADGTSSNSDGDVVTSQGVMFSRIATHDYAAPALWVLASKFGRGVAVRIDAQIVWRPLRTAAEYVPTDVTTATRTPSCPLGAACVDPLAVVDGNAARELADYFNSLDTQPPGDNYGCHETASPAIITFDVPSGPLTFDVPTCGGVTVTANGVAQPTLDTTDVALDPQQRGLLGLSNGTLSSPAPALSAVSAVSSASAVAASNGPPQPTR